MSAVRFVGWKVAGFGVVSWLAGVCVHVLALQFFYGQPISPEDVVAVTLYSGLAMAIVTPGILTPLFFAFRRVARETWLTLFYPLLGSAWFPLETTVVFLLFGGWEGFRWSDLASHEARLFHLQFAATGFFFGWGFLAIFYVPRRDR